MCGILGIFDFKTDAQKHRGALDRGLEKMHSRGPDYRGVFEDKHALLGHNRLSIIDTSADAHQPFFSSDKRYVLVFNGEIFNFKTLKSDLEKKGEQFLTKSDTEVLLRLYMIYRADCLNMLNGFFSFCVYDTLQQTAFLGTDRYGIKPFYYTEQNDFFAFGSELKGLMQFNIQRVIDRRALKTYFHLHYVPAPYSMFDRVSKLLPGHFLLLDLKQQKITQHQYYTLEVAPSEDDYPTAQKKVRDLLASAVEKRLVSDVPLGCFLSGGIDSSIVATLATQQKSNLQTFSIGFKDHTFFDETHYAQAVADKIGSTHTVYKLSNQDLLDNIDSIFDYVDEPFADSSMIAVYALCKQVKQHCTVALSGDGADEVFSGYHKHGAFYRMLNTGVSEKVVSNLGFLAGLMPQSRGGVLSNKARQVYKYYKGSKLGLKASYWSWAGFEYVNDLQALVKTTSTHNINENQWIGDIEKQKGINAVLLADQKMVLSGDMLVKVDRMSMASSLEVRSPFLDYRLVDYVNSLPEGYKINNQIKKRILQESFKKDLPDMLFNRSKKGFEIPLQYWLKNSLNNQVNWAFDRVSSQSELFDERTVLKLQKKLNSNHSGDAPASIFAMLIFQKWYDTYFN